ncbi:MAG: putative DNA binding domain-containing protein [Akkermansia sp.]|nr:putative DNA binding domain-containing protein [Akkermansia sp.]
MLADNHINQLLNTFLSKREDEVLEFKEAKKGLQTDDLRKYISALSNEANLRRKDCAWLIYGVSDKFPRRAVGTEYQIPAKLKQDIAGSMTAGLTLREIYETEREGKRILMFQIPAAPKGIPIAWNGHYFGRNGESTCALSIDKIEEIRRQTEDDWSAGIIEDASMDDLDPQAIRVAKVEFLKRNPKYAEEMSTWDDATFLNKAKLTRRGKITRTALILLGKDEAEHLLSPAVAKIRWNLKTVRNEDKDYEIFGIPFILSTEEVYRKIRNLKFRYLLNEQSLFPEELLRYEPFCIRELLYNCIAHQDYTKRARINVVEVEDHHLIFSNYGTFIPLSIERVIEADAPEESYRNPFLVEAMRNLNMIETQGGGIRKVYTFQRKRLFPMPDYDFSEGKVRATLHGCIISEDFARMLQQDTELPLHTVLALDKVQKQRPLSDEEWKDVKKRELVEGRKTAPYLSHRTVEMLETNEFKEQYIRNKAFDNNYYKKLILSYIYEWERASLSQLEQLLTNKLPDSYTQVQKKRKISNLLAELRRDECIVWVSGKVWKLTAKGNDKRLKL